MKQRRENHRPHNQPAPFLGPGNADVGSTKCFIVMPYTAAWSAGVERVLKRSCKAAGLKFIIAKTMPGRFVLHDIWKGITGSAVIIADLTGANPNVCYEVGLADVLGRNVILLSQKSKVPFNFLAQRLIIYENTLKGSSALEKELTTRLKEVSTKSILSKETPAVRRFHGYALDDGKRGKICLIEDEFQLTFSDKNQPGLEVAGIYRGTVPAKDGSTMQGCWKLSGFQHGTYLSISYVTTRTNGEGIGGFFLVRSNVDSWDGFYFGRAQAGDPFVISPYHLLEGKKIALDNHRTTKLLQALGKKLLPQLINRFRLVGATEIKSTA